MRLRIFCAALIGCAAIASGGVMAANPQATAKPSATQILQFDFEATVHADGSVTDVEPDGTLPDPIKRMIRKRAATWRFNAPQWQGRTAASTRIQKSVRAVPVATAEGGLALRIEYVTESEKTDVIKPQPKYPTALRRRGVGAVLVYAVLFDEAGKPQQADLVSPVERNPEINRFDEAAREAIPNGIWPKTFEGKPISCREGVPFVFETGSEDNTPEPPRKQFKGGDPFEKYSDMCPTTTFIITRVEGTFL